VEMTFGERVALLRRRQDMTQKQLGKEAEVHHNTIARLERGFLKDLPGRYVKRLAKALGCSSDFLLGLSDDPDGEILPALTSLA